MRLLSKLVLAITLLIPSIESSQAGALLLDASATGQVSFTGPDLTSDNGGSKACSGVPLSCSATAGGVGATGGYGSGAVEATVVQSQAFFNAPFTVDPTIKATVTTSSSADGGQSGSATGHLTYYFSVTPIRPDQSFEPSIFTNIHSMNVQGSIDLTPNTNNRMGDASNASAIFTVSTIAGRHLYQTSSAGSFSQDIFYLFLTDYTVDMFVQAVTGSNTSTEAASAAIDPIFTLTPEDALNFQIVYSPGIMVASAIPEPSTWAMLLIGFAGIGFVTCRRSRRQLPTAVMKA